MKLAKLAAKFSTKAKSTYNKALDQTTSTCTSLFSSFTPLDNDANNKYNSSDSYYVAKNGSQAIENVRKKSGSYDDKNDNEETYDVERIKFEEMSSKMSLNTNSYNGNTSRYKKIYKSFKSTMRRNSSASNSSSSMTSMNNGSKLNTSSPNYFLNSEQNFHDDFMENKLGTNGLNVFQNGYGYDDDINEKSGGEKNENSFYDHSIYPYAKTIPTNASLSRTSKKVYNLFALYLKK